MRCIFFSNLFDTEYSLDIYYLLSTILPPKRLIKELNSGKDVFIVSKLLIMDL